jgi:2-octaprenylphenol hydroxylase
MDVDIAIVGGGMVGLALARLLVDYAGDSTSLTVAMIEEGHPLAVEDAELRVSALNRGAIDQLVGWGLWTSHHFPDRGFYRHMEVWEAASSGKVIFHASDVGQPFLGAIVKNQQVVEALKADLIDRPSVTFFSPMSWTSIDRVPEAGWEISLSNGQILSAKVLVGADGAKSLIRERLGIEVNRSDYKQQAIVAKIQSEKPHQSTAYQRFLTEGPVAFLPLADTHEGSLVWTVSRETSERLLALPEIEFNDELTVAFNHRLGALTLASNRLHFPLKTHHAKEYTRSGAFLVGDAAHGVHPLAGQGVNLGFHDVRVFGQILHEAKTLKRPLLTDSNFKKYERQAFGYNETIRQSMTVINRLFLNQQPHELCSKIRGSGMDFMDRYGILKGLFSQVAQG